VNDEPIDPVCGSQVTPQSLIGNSLRLRRAELSPGTALS